MIRANDPRLQKITIAEHGYLTSEGSPVPEGIPLAGSSPSHQVVEDKGDMGLSEEGFGVFDQADPVFQLPHHSPSLSRLGFLLPDRSHNLPNPNFLPLPNLLYLLGLSPPTQKGRGVPRVRSQWAGGNPAPLERRTKPRELKNN